jgi:hypothetical protein
MAPPQKSMPQFKLVDAPLVSHLNPHQQLRSQKVTILMFGHAIVNAIFAGSSYHFYGECKNEQGSWRNKFHVNRISSFGVMN